MIRIASLRLEWVLAVLTGMLLVGMTAGSFSCRHRHIEFQPAFYSWQSNWQPHPGMASYLDSLGVKILYLRLFDLDWVEGNVQPVSEWLGHAPMDSDRNLIPVVFITNRAFESAGTCDADCLADKVWKKISLMFRERFRSRPVEVQIDCDWTQTTRGAYFAFLQALRSLALREGCIVSATIRLHQVTWAQKTGVPPVNKGMLMWYNTGDIEDWSESNAILDDRHTSAYLEGFDTYPLPLDLALPVFSWGVLFRDGQLELLIHPLQESDLQDSTYFIRTAPHFYAVRRSGYFKGHYLYPGDKIRWDHAEREQLVKAMQQVKQVWKRPVSRVAFFHLDSSVMHHYPAEWLLRLLDH